MNQQEILKLITLNHLHCDWSALCEKVAGGAMTSQRPDLECEDTTPPACLTDSQTDRGWRRTWLFYGGCGSLILIAAYMLWLTATSPHVKAN